MSPTTPTPTDPSTTTQDDSREAEEGEDEDRPAVVCVFCASSPGKNPIHLASARRLARCLYDADISLVYGGGTMGIMGELAQTLVGLYDGDDGSDRNTSTSRVHGVIPRALVKVEPGISGGVGVEEGRDKGGGGSEGQSLKAGDGTMTAAGKEAERNLPNTQSTNNDNDNSNDAKKSPYGTLTVVPDMHTRKRQMAQHVTSGNRKKGSGFVALAGGYGTVEEVMEMVTWNQLGIHHMPIVLVNVDGYWDGLLKWVGRAVEEGFVSKGNADILVEVKDVDEVVGALRQYRVSEARWRLDWTRT